ncbi:DNA topoisomerase I [Candidatus Phytoplasma luffae]|uniref:DNA topoisomerase 1 n=1 Tax=Loofah witches'-broom phytoplasma TaxID=35773 RepID=A0A975INM5_LOWBP|nr:type I DNA topoisomerase [Candidatus Phytoplasma luffae]QTX03051.1 DNA topoisomerase I [Candidatus Phytoplasma luffae]
MKNTVIILESPAKAKTISRFLGKDVLVLYSKGHVRDLSLTGKDRLGIDILNNFEPNYQIIDKQKKTVDELIKKTKNKKVFLATDPDREGESIAWHLAQILKLDEKEKNRVSFNEITKDIVQKAFANPCVIKKDLVNSQETRRILDRIIGFRLSYLVRKIKSSSAGRVQSVALKLVVELEQERNNFVPEEYNLIKAHFENFKADLIITPKCYKIKKEEAEKIVKQIGIRPFVLKEIQNKKQQKKPPQPFITATLQQEAFKILSFSAKNTMSIAQKLYEGIDLNGQRIGLITYMRTDSFRISVEFSEKVQKFIKERYGKEYLGILKTKKEINNIGDAHEAIRVTNITMIPEDLTQYLNKYELSLYKLIYERTLASFMSNAIVNKNQLFFEIDEFLFLAEGQEMIFEGYYKALNNSFKNNFLPNLKVNQEYIPNKIEIIPKTTTPPARFNEASLIKKLEILKIGRPSTYVSIIEILKKRFYIQIEDKQIIPTEIGTITKDFLDKFFSSLINVNYTAQMEKELDDISCGKINKLIILQNFYKLFQKLFQTAYETIQKNKPKITQQKCDLCGDFLVERRSKYGLFLGCNSFPKCKKVVSLKK